MKNKNKKTFIAMILLIIFLMVLGFLSFIFFYNLKNNSEEDYVSKFTTMGESLYTDYYYEVTKVGKTDQELKDFLSMFKDIGLQFNLVEMEKYSDENKELIEKFVKQNKDCKKEETMLIIYPKEPYSKTDFTSELRMDCGVKK